MKKRSLLITIISISAIAITATMYIGAAIVFAKNNVQRSSGKDLEGDEYDQWCNSWSKPGHMYFHYNRGEGASDYDNYALWVWPYYPDSLEGTLWGYGGKTQVSDTLTLKPMSTAFMQCQEVGAEGSGTYCDKYGIIFDVDLSSTSLVGGKTGVPVTFEGSEEIGFLYPRVDSMDGTKNWISDGGIENYITDYTKEENWRQVRDGKAIHVFTSTGSLDQYSYFAGGGVPQPLINPIDVDTTGNYRSKVEDIPVCTKEAPTSNKFKDIGVGYQVFVASFRDTNGDGIGDINGITESLDYLQDLGVQCLWLTPIQRSGSYHGYDTIDYTEIDRRFGTMEDYENLLSEAHSRGMTVLMDLVLNHTSKSNVWFSKSKWGEESEGIKWRDVYTWKYKTDKIKKANVQKEGDKWVVKGYSEITVQEDAESNNPSWYKDGESNYYYYGKFGSGMPEINYENKATRQLIIDTAKFWLNKGLDGFRLDAVKHIYMKDEVADTGDDVIIEDVGEKESYDEERGEYIAKKYDYSSDLTKNVNWWKEFSSSLKSTNPNCFLVGENFDGWGTRTATYYQALDSQFDFSNYYHVPAWIYNTDAGAAKFDTTEGNGGQAIETYVPFASSDTFKLGDTGPTIEGGKRPDFINGAFTSNHDVMRLINQANGVGDQNNTVANDNVRYNDPFIDGKAKFQAAVTILNPGLSWIYYGDELGMSSNTFEHIEKYGSENNMDIWYRQPFLWRNKSARANYKSGQYAFELDEHNRHLVNNEEGIEYNEIKNGEGQVTGHEIKTLSSFYPYYKVLTSIKNAYPKNSKIEYHYSSENVLRIHVTGDGTKELEIFLNNGRNLNEYKMSQSDLTAQGFTFLAATEGAPTYANGNIGGSLFGVAAFVKGEK